jgi:hypothetical protein
MVLAFSTLHFPLFTVHASRFAPSPHPSSSPRLILSASLRLRVSFSGFCILRVPVVEKRKTLNRGQVPTDIDTRQSGPGGTGDSPVDGAPHRPPKQAHGRGRPCQLIPIPNENHTFAGASLAMSGLITVLQQRPCSSNGLRKRSPYMALLLKGTFYWERVSILRAVRAASVNTTEPGTRLSKPP